MTFFYDLNKRMADLAKKQDAQQITEEAKVTAPKSQLVESMGVAEADYSAKKAAAGKDIGKPGKNFAKIAKSAGAKYGSKAAGERVAGAVLNKLRHPKESEMDESAFQAAIGKKKYGDEGMKALQKAGREHAGKEKMANIRAKYDKYDESAEQDGDVMDWLNDQLKDYDAEQTKEGNAFTGKLKATPKGEKFKLGDKEFKDTSDLEEGFKEMDAWLASREKEKGTGRFDKKKISTGTVYTRKPETFDDPETDPEATGGAPKRVGRPKGKDKGPERVTAKSYKYKAGRPTKTKEDLDVDGVMMTRPTNCSSESIEPGDRGEYDQEGESAKHDIKTIVRHAQALHKILGDDDNLPEWVQSKLAKIEGMMIAVDEYMQNQDQEVSEKAPPGAKAERMVKHVKKSLSKDGKLSDKDKAIAYATTWKAHNAGKVEEEGVKPDFLDVDKDGDKKETFKKAVKDKKEKTVDETTTAGSVATAPEAAKSSKGMQFGKGVYEGFNNKVERMITEGMSVTINMSAGEEGEPRKSINVTADGDDADKLAELLKMAGLEQKQEVCPACGHSPCDCEETVEEAYGDTDETLNNPDWPTDKETLEAEPNLRTYSGGLNGPKSTGQTTIPVIASQARRQTSMEEGVKLERSLFKTWKNYKG